MRYLVTVKLINGTFIHLIPEFSQAICSWWKSERSFNLSSTTNIRSRWVFPSPFNLNICTVNCTTETEGMFWEKAALNPLVSRWIMPFEFSFCEGKTRFTYAIAANKRANSHNFKIKKLNLLTITFLAVYSVLKMLPSAYCLGQYFQDLGHNFSPYGPPSRQITYIYQRIILHQALKWKEYRKFDYCSCWRQM